VTNAGLVAGTQLVFALGRWGLIRLALNSLDSCGFATQVVADSDLGYPAVIDATPGQSPGLKTLLRFGTRSSVIPDSSLCSE
jgi:hypothetical protein